MKREWPRFYVLRGRVPFAVDMETWGSEIENPKRQIAKTTIGRSLVSTCFLGLDHNFFGKGDPILFETMVFGGPLDGETMRYTSYADAVRGHREIVARVRKAIASIDAMKAKAHSHGKSKT